MAQAWLAEPAAPGTPAGRNVIVVVDRAPGDARGPRAAALEGKDTVERLLGELGATDIVAAQSLSFVTATVPVDRLGEPAASKSVRRIGDGEERLRAPALGPSAGPDLPPGGLGRAAWAATTLTGKGVSVAILDDGIHSDVLDGKVAQRQHCAGLSGCRGQAPAGGAHGGGEATHGTRVAGVIAAPPGEFRGAAFPSGIAPGATLLDVVTHSADGGRMAALAHGLDWALASGAHVAVVAAGAPWCSAGDAAPLVADEAAEMGMIVVGAAGDGGTQAAARARTGPSTRRTARATRSPWAPPASATARPSSTPPPAGGRPPGRPARC